MTVGDRIKFRRNQLHLSVDEVARSIGKDRSTIYRYESHDIEDLPVSVIKPLAQALRTSPAYLMGWNNNSELNTNQMLLSDHEKTVVTAYRDNPEMQPAIDKLLNISEDGVYVLRAARSKTNEPIEYIKISKEKMEEIRNAKSVEDEVDL